MSSDNIPAARPYVGDEEVAAVTRVLRGGHLAQGSEVAAFEGEFSEMVEGRHCIAVNSGTSALALALTASGIGRGDEVIVPSFTFAGTANAVSISGATPVFADIDDRTFCLSPDSVRAAITSATAAIIPVHLYGQPADMAGITRVATSHGLAIIEDAAQAHGALWRDRPTGALGDAAAFSFYPTKNMHAIEGGMVVTPSPHIAHQVRLLRNQGMAERYRHVIVGHSLRLTEVSAAVGRVQLRRLPAMNQRRAANAARLNSRLTGWSTPYVAEGATHTYHQYTIRVRGDNRNLLHHFLHAQGIESSIFYPVPVHRLPPFLDKHGRPAADLPRTDLCAREVLSLPVHPAVSDTDLDRIASAMRAFGGTKE
jgi:perosamine synthetase